jgi:hypothetical protein
MTSYSLIRRHKSSVHMLSDGLRVPRVTLHKAHKLLSQETDLSGMQYHNLACYCVQYGPFSLKICRVRTPTLLTSKANCQHVIP